ncbi:hypothetical protein U1Q18_034378 [Sarracenia purpurea var. burkii]
MSFCNMSCAIVAAGLKAAAACSLQRAAYSYWAILFLVLNLGLFAAEWVLFAVEFGAQMLLIAAEIGALFFVLAISLETDLGFECFFPSWLGVSEGHCCSGGSLAFGLDAAGSQSLFVAISVVFLLSGYDFAPGLLAFSLLYFCRELFEPSHCPSFWEQIGLALGRCSVVPWSYCLTLVL